MKEGWTGGLCSTCTLCPMPSLHFPPALVGGLLLLPRHAAPARRQAGSAAVHAAAAQLPPPAAAPVGLQQQRRAAGDEGMRVLWAGRGGQAQRGLRPAGGVLEAV